MAPEHTHAYSNVNRPHVFKHLHDQSRFLIRDKQVFRTPVYESLAFSSIEYITTAIVCLGFIVETGSLNMDYTTTRQRNLLMYGPAGSGKSKISQFVRSRLGGKQYKMEGDFQASEVNGATVYCVEEAVSMNNLSKE